jgi:peptide-methionine (S)-S-oxide reductase
MDRTTEVQTITLGGGCFWCLEAVFEKLRGVEKVISGYAGGTLPDPTYQQVCSGRSGHAEVVQITFDPQILTLRELLEIFFAFHDPTTPNRQGADVGPQYRSIILYHSREQKQTAEQVIAEFEGARLWGAPIVTELVPLTAFYPAEEFHRHYFRRHPEQAYCRMVIAPKVARLRENYRGKLKG